MKKGPLPQACALVVPSGEGITIARAHACGPRHTFPEISLSRCCRTCVRKVGKIAEHWGLPTRAPTRGRLLDYITLLSKAKLLWHVRTCVFLELRSENRFRTPKVAFIQRLYNCHV